MSDKHHGPNATESCPVCNGTGLIFPPSPDNPNVATIRRCPEWTKEES
jgi:hypothetical protein